MSQLPISMPVIEVRPDRVVVRPDPVRQRRMSLLVGGVGAFFVLVGTLVLFFHGMGGLAGALVAMPLGGLLVWAACAPGTNRHAVVTEEGLRVVTRRGTREEEVHHPPETIDRLELHHRSRRDSEGREWSRWTVRFGLEDGSILDLVESPDRGRIRACAAGAHRILQKNSGRRIRLIDPATSGGQDLSETGLDRSLVEVVQASPTSAPASHPRFRLEPGATGGRILLVRPELGPRIRTALLSCPFAALLCGIGAAGTLGLLGSLLDPDPSMTIGWRVGLGLLALLPLSFVLVGLLSLGSSAIRFLGREYLRVDALGLEHGFLLASRHWLRKRHGATEIENVRAVRGLELIEGGVPRFRLFRGLARSDAEWLAQATRWLLAQAVASGPSPEPLATESRGKIAAHHAGDHVAIRVGGIRWSWLLGGSLFSLVFLALGATATAALLYGSLAPGEETPAAARVFGTLFAAIPGFMAWWGGKAFASVLRLFALGSYVHVIRPGILDLHSPGAREPEQIELSGVERVKIESGNLLLVERERDVALGFHRLAGADELERARTLLCRLLERYGGVVMG